MYRFIQWPPENSSKGVFVDGAIQLANEDRSVMMKKEAYARENSATHLMDLLEQIDEDGSGTISKDELENQIHL